SNCESELRDLSPEQRRALRIPSLLVDHTFTRGKRRTEHRKAKRPTPVMASVSFLLTGFGDLDGERFSWLVIGFRGRSPNVRQHHWRVLVATATTDHDAHRFMVEKNRCRRCCFHIVSLRFCLVR